MLSAGVSGWAGQQDRRCSTVPPGLDTVTQILQGVLALLAASVNDRQHALHEAAALRAVRPAARLAPQHGPTPRPLRFVVGWLNPLDAHERPQPTLVGQQLLARPGRLATAARKPAPQFPP